MANNTYAPGHRASQVKHHAWRTAENSAAYLLPRLHEMASKTPQLKLLDVGAGPGTITASFAKHIPQGRITATEISDDILDRARQHAVSEGVPDGSIHFQRADIFHLPFPDATFDVTHTHQVLCHLSDPVSAIRELVRVTKAGGVVAIREADLRTWCIWPRLPPLVHFCEVMAQTLVANGGKDEGGRQLVSWALDAGVSRADIEATFSSMAYCDADARQMWGNAMTERLKTGQLRHKAMEMGVATEADIQAMIAAWDEWMRHDGATSAIMNGEIIINIV